MKMKKTLFLAAAVAVMSMTALTACGGKAPEAGSAAVATDPSEALTGKVEVGKFNVTVPENWSAFPQADIFGSQDDSGSYPVSKDQILLAKDVTDEWEAYQGPNIRIYSYDRTVIGMDSRDFYDNVKDLEGISIKGTPCSGYQGDSLDYTYQFITYETGGCRFEIQILTAVGGKATGISWESPDVKEILESLEPTGYSAQQAETGAQEAQPAEEAAPAAEVPAEEVPAAEEMY